RAPSEPELSLADEECTRVHGDAQAAHPLAPLAQGRQHRAGVASGQRRVAQRIPMLAAALGHRVDDDTLAARLDRDGRVAIDGSDQRGRPPQHGPLAGDEELAGGAGCHAHSRTSAPAPGALVTTRATPGTDSSACATRGASAGWQSTFTCGPASMVMNAGVPSARSAHTRCTHSTVAPRQ